MWGHALACIVLDCSPPMCFMSEPLQERSVNGPSALPTRLVAGLRACRRTLKGAKVDVDVDVHGSGDTKTT